jgi:hypothetical protein
VGDDMDAFYAVEDPVFDIIMPRRRGVGGLDRMAPRTV